MHGFPLTMFSNALTRVPAHRTKKPSLAFDLEKTMGPEVLAWAKDYCGDFDAEFLVRRLPASVLLKAFTFDQVCKIRYSGCTTMASSVDELFRDVPEYAIVRKIDNCMWRWGCGSGVWNEVVDAYNGIRNFKIPLEDFDVRLDFTTGSNERGYALESRTYLDGVFGFLVYYKGEHVMTLGFSIADRRRVLVQQVQLVRRKGNRFLFRMPENRIEFFLNCFAAAFPRHKLCMADGSDICQVNIDSYQHGLDRALESLRRKPSETNLKDKQEYEARIEHLRADSARLTAFYANTGRFIRDDEFKINGIRHYRLAAPAAA